MDHTLLSMCQSNFSLSDGQVVGATPCLDTAKETQSCNLQYNHVQLIMDCNCLKQVPYFMSKSVLIPLIKRESNILNNTKELIFQAF